MQKAESVQLRDTAEPKSGKRKVTVSRAVAQVLSVHHSLAAQLLDNWFGGKNHAK